MSTITWKNTQQPNFYAAAQIGQQAGNKLISGFGQLSNASKEFGDNANKANTAKLLGELQSMHSMDDYNAGASKFTSANLVGQNVDINKILNAYNNTDARIHKDIADKNKWNDAPINEKYLGQIYDTTNVADLDAMSKKIKADKNLTSKTTSLSEIELRRKLLKGQANDEQLMHIRKNAAKLSTDRAAVEAKNNRDSDYADKFSVELHTAFPNINSNEIQKKVIASGGDAKILSLVQSRMRVLQDNAVNLSKNHTTEFNSAITSLNGVLGPLVTSLNTYNTRYGEDNAFDKTKTIDSSLTTQEAIGQVSKDNADNPMLKWNTYGGEGLNDLITDYVSKENKKYPYSKITGQDIQQMGVSIAPNPSGWGQDAGLVNTDIFRGIQQAKNARLENTQRKVNTRTMTDKIGVMKGSINAEKITMTSMIKNDLINYGKIQKSTTNYIDKAINNLLKQSNSILKPSFKGEN